MSTAMQDHPLGSADVRYQRLLASLESAAEAIEEGLVIRAGQLDELRRAADRLRRGIEVYSSGASATCEQCGEAYVPLRSATPCCTDARPPLEALCTETS